MKAENVPVPVMKDLITFMMNFAKIRYACGDRFGSGENAEVPKTNQAKSRYWTWVIVRF